jgi:hypothetical protein
VASIVPDTRVHTVPKAPELRPQEKPEASAKSSNHAEPRRLLIENRPLTVHHRRARDSMRGTGLLILNLQLVYDLLHVWNT